MTPEERKLLYETHATVQNKLLPDIQETKDTLQRIEDKLGEVSESCTSTDVVLKSHSDDISSLEDDVEKLKAAAVTNGNVIKATAAIVIAALSAWFWTFLSNFHPFK